MSADRDAEIDAAYEAFETFAKAKRKADASLTFPDCHDAAQAWVKFINLYVPTEQKLPEVAG